ncbi:Uncharacterised protein [Mycobacteroides abscessus subsp. abscessus]|nr:Uncharacterised protein [Mycobacteroides abscessus subsp. abscessus]
MAAARGDPQIVADFERVVDCMTVLHRVGEVAAIVGCVIEAELDRLVGLRVEVDQEHSGP